MGPAHDVSWVAFYEIDHCALDCSISETRHPENAVVRGVQRFKSSRYNTTQSRELINVHGQKQVDPLLFVFHVVREHQLLRPTLNASG